MYVYYSENIGALKNSAQSTLSVLNKWNNKTCLLTTWPTKFFKPAVEIYSGKKKKGPIKISLHIDNTTGHPKG